MNVPDDLRYSTDHEWVRVEGGRVRIGITDYAQDALGDVVFVAGARGRAPRSTPAAAISEVESTKSVSDIYAPVAGTIVEVNADLADAPERLNEDPYGEGWICVHRAHDAAELDGAARRRRLPGADRGLGTAWPTSSATTAGTANPLGSQLLLVVRRRRSSAPERARHHDRRSLVADRQPPPRRSRSSSTTCRRASACSSSPAARTPARGSPLDEPVVTAGRHPDSDIFLDDITVSRRHAEVRAGRRRLRGARRRLAQRHLPEPRADRARPRSHDGDELQVGKFKLALPRRRGREPRHGRPLAPVHRRGPQPAPGRVPRRHHLQDPLPREPGPARPRAHAVGLPQVLRGRHRAAALDPRASSATTSCR